MGIGGRGKTPPLPAREGKYVSVKFLDTFFGQIRGHKLAVLGERAVGKTHLQTFLRDGKIPTVYGQTLGQHSLRPGRAQLWTFESMAGATQAKLYLRAGYDVPGAAEAVAAWGEVLQTASVLLYLFRADQLYDGDRAHTQRMLEDAEVITKAVQATGP